MVAIGCLVIVHNVTCGLIHILINCIHKQRDGNNQIKKKLKYLLCLCVLLNGKELKNKNRFFFLFFNERETWALRFKELLWQRVFGNGALRKVFGPKREQVKSRWDSWHNDYFHDRYTSRYSIRFVLSRRMRWVCYVAYMAEDKKRTQSVYFVAKHHGGECLENLVFERRMLLKWTFEK